MKYYKQNDLHVRRIIQLCTVQVYLADQQLLSGINSIEHITQIGNFSKTYQGWKGHNRFSYLSLPLPPLSYSFNTPYPYIDLTTKHDKSIFHPHEMNTLSYKPFNHMSRHPTV